MAFIVHVGAVPDAVGDSQQPYRPPICGRVASDVMQADRFPQSGGDPAEVVVVRGKHGHPGRGSNQHDVDIHHVADARGSGEGAHFVSIHGRH